MQENKKIKPIEENENATPQKKSSKVLSVLLSVVILIITFCAGYFSNYLFTNKKAMFAKDIVSLMDRVGYIYDQSTGTFREITKEDIGDALANGVLDDYSAYYTEEEYRQVSSNSDGNYVGFGISFYDSDLIIDSVSFNSPFDHAGVKVGDKLVSASKQGQEKVVFSSLNDAMNFMNTVNENEQVDFTYLRAGNPNTVSVKKCAFVRSHIYYADDKFEYVFTSNLGEKPQGTQKELSLPMITSADVGYIKFDMFSGDAFAQMQSALSFMKERGKTKLILDLRNNGGGYMDVLTKIASLYIYNGGKSSSVVAISQGKTNQEKYKTDKNRFQSFIEEMVVLANDNTASAAECLIGAIVTYGDLTDGVKNVIVEKNDSGIAKTYGKGIMQTTYKLLSGGAFKLTTAKILWPDGNTCIHGVGVTQSMGATVCEKGQALQTALNYFAN